MRVRARKLIAGTVLCAFDSRRRLGHAEALRWGPVFLHGIGPRAQCEVKMRNLILECAGFGLGGVCCVNFVCMAVSAFEKKVLAQNAKNGAPGSMPCVLGWVRPRVCVMVAT